MPAEGTIVFVSYSHADESLVAPVVKLLRVNKSLVFQDIDQIQPGKKWRSEIEKALAEAELVVVFWCDHASRSSEVSKEWKAAIEHEKDLLPLLLDATPLPPELSEFQWIDFRGTVGANHTSIDSPTPPLPAPSKSGRWLPLAGLATVVIAIAGGLFFSTLNAPTELSSSAPVSRPTNPSITVPPIPESAPDSSIMLLLSVVLAAIVGITWIFRRRSKRGAIVEASSQSEEVEQRIASELGVEILRRTTKKKRDAEA